MKKKLFYLRIGARLGSAYCHLKNDGYYYVDLVERVVPNFK